MGDASSNVEAIASTAVVDAVLGGRARMLDEPFQVQRGVQVPPGTFNFNEWEFTYNTNPARRVYGRFTFEPNQFYDGTSRNVSAATGVRVTSRLSSELQYTRNDVELHGGGFVLDLAVLRVDYAFSPRMTLRSLTQYNSSSHELSSSIRFNYTYRPGSDLYIVYNDLRPTGLPPGTFGPSDRQLVLKLNYMLAW